MPTRALSIFFGLLLLGACGGAAKTAAPAGAAGDTNQIPASTQTPGATAASTLPAGCTTAAAVAATAVAVHDFAYVPACIKVAKGTQVVFTNQDAVSHTVTANSGSPDTFDSGDVAPAASFSHTFAQAGGTGIHCTYHPGMLMGVIVE